MRATCSYSAAQSPRFLSGSPLQGMGRIHAASPRCQQRVSTLWRELLLQCMFSDVELKECELRVCVSRSW